MSSLDLVGYLEHMFAGWLGSDQEITPSKIEQSVSDAGYDPKDLQNVDMKKVYQDACQHPGVPPEYKTAADNYDGPSDYTHVVRQIQQVTEVHNVTQQFVDNSTNVDNSINLQGANVDGPLDIHNNPVTAGDGGVAAGGNVDGAATGDHSNATGSGNIAQADGGSTAIGGDNNGIANSGAHAGIVDQGTHIQGEPGYIIDPVRGLDPGYGTGDSGELSRTLTGVHPPADHGPVTLNTGDGTQQVAQVQGNGDQVNFGAGDNTNLPGAQVENSAIGHDGVGTFNNDQFDHSQVGVAGHDQGQEYQDDSVHNHIEDSPYSHVTSETGPGNLEEHPDHVHADHIIHPS
jgi:hypothetical protein